jgi:hypothetical protein
VEWPHDAPGWQVEPQVGVVSASLEGVPWAWEPDGFFRDFVPLDSADGNPWLAMRLDYREGPPDGQWTAAGEA